MSDRDIGKVIGGLGCLVALYVVMVGVFTLAWNATVPTLFGGPPILWWQSMALLALAGIVGSTLRKS